MGRRRDPQKRSHVALNVRVPQDTAQRVRVYAAVSRRSIQDIVREAIERTVPAMRVR